MKFRERKFKKPGDKCGAQLRGKPGRYCQKPAMNNGSGRCELHGGKSLRGTMSKRYKNGLYSAYLTDDLRNKLQDMDVENPLDLSSELGILRGLLATYLDQVKQHETDENSTSFNLAAQINVVSELINKITGTVDKIVKIRNDTALTIAELKIIAAKLAEKSEKFIPDKETRDQYLKEVFEDALPIRSDNEYAYIEPSNE